MSATFSPYERLVLVGTMFPSADDRELPRAALRPVQIVGPDGRVPVPYFDVWGERGPTAMAFTVGRVIVTTGDDLWSVDLATGDADRCRVVDLRDVHEMQIDDGVLWIANTGRDELVAVDPTAGTEVERVSLAGFRLEHVAAADEDTVDTFHANQVFTTLAGERAVLVHHVTGRQRLRRVAERLLKKQGDGGVVEIASGRRHRLGLRGPHTVRLHDSLHWLFDSGAASLNAYDVAWRSVDRIGLRGWGRGAAVSTELGLMYAGISKTRTRYLGLFPAAMTRVPNLIQIVDLHARAVVSDIVLDDVEQVSNLYLVAPDVAEAMLALDPRSAPSAVQATER